MRRVRTPDGVVAGDDRPAGIGHRVPGGSGDFFHSPARVLPLSGVFATTSDLQTGFSDHVQLGSIGQIQQSTAVIMRVRIDGDTRGAYDLKWRGIGLSNFNGHTWSNPFEQRVIFRTPQGRLLIDQTPPGPASRRE